MTGEAPRTRSYRILRSVSTTLGRSALLVTGVMLALLLCEGVLRYLGPLEETVRVRDPAAGFRYAPHLSVEMASSEYSVTFETNSAGFRDDEPSSDARRKLLLLGDSFAVGYGVERPRIFADLLENQIGIEVLNLSAGGYDLINEVGLYRSVRDKRPHDAVLLALFLGNDLVGNDFWRTGGDGSLVPVRGSLYSAPPRLLLLLDAAFNRMRRLSSGTAEWTPSPEYLVMCERRSGEESSRNYRSAFKFIEELHALVSAKQRELYVVLVPYRQMIDAAARERFLSRVPDRRDRYDLGKPARVLREFLAAQRIPHLDLSPGLRAAGDSGGRPLYFAEDGHFTERGHAVTAALIERFLVSHGW